MKFGSIYIGNKRKEARRHLKLATQSSLSNV